MNNIVLYIYGGLLKSGYPKWFQILDHFIVEPIGFADPPIYKLPHIWIGIVTHNFCAFRSKLPKGLSRLGRANIQYSAYYEQY